MRKPSGGERAWFLEKGSEPRADEAACLTVPFITAFDMLSFDMEMEEWDILSRAVRRMAAKNTIQEEVTLSGTGVHTGQKVSVRLKPSEEGSIVFCRTDLDNLSVRIDPNKVESEHCSALVSGRTRILTLEHLMACLFAFGVDSLVVELDGDEIPILDGSARPFAQAIQRAGLRPLSQPKKILKICKPFLIEEGEASVGASPDPEFKITYSIAFNHPAIGCQKRQFLMSPEAFAGEIAPARTFGFLEDVPSLRKRGLALGGSLENALVLDEKGIINGPLRFSDEFVRHKILDFIGDLSFCGMDLKGHFKARRAGHRLHLKLVRFLKDNPDYGEVVNS